MPPLTAQEGRVLDHLRTNPFLTQQDLADLFGSARSTVATHIRSLVDKGYIEGRAYVLGNGRARRPCVL
ncbi:MAG: winged helix-turn-helix transcriptional regulator [Acidobacteria bacterium]|nr:winged helix-turn-helix transcriptional regulator [Acidobacteriota bacterium]